MSADRSAQVVPNIYVDAIEEIRDFYIDRLGFAHMMGVVGRDGKLDFCIVTRSGAMVMFARPQGQMDGAAPAHTSPRPLAIYFEVRDVDAYHHEVASRGVSVVDPLTSQWWGDRTFAVRDPYGYQLWFYQHVGEMAPPPGVTVV